MENEHEGVLSDEEISEQEKVAKDDGLREKIVKELGLTDDETNKEMIDKLVDRESGLRKGYGTLLGKYKGLRDGGNHKKPEIKQSSDQGKKETLTPDDIRKQSEAAVRGQLDEEYLDESDHSDEIKAVIRSEAKRLGVSARKAEKSEFVQFKINKEQEANRASEAAKNGSQKGKQGKVIDRNFVPNPSDYDLSTEEGRKQWDEDKKAAKAARNK